MKGNNVLYLNEATVMEALQMWLASKYPEKTPLITHVEQMSSAGYSKTAGTFEVTLVEHGTTLA